MDVERPNNLFPITSVNSPTAVGFQEPSPGRTGGLCTWARAPSPQSPGEMNGPPPPCRGCSGPGFRFQSRWTFFYLACPSFHLPDSLPSPVGRNAGTSSAWQAGAWPRRLTDPVLLTPSWTPAPPLDPHLAVDEDHGAQQPPGASLAVHVQHPQDLEEADAPAKETTHVPAGAPPAPLVPPSLVAGSPPGHPHESSSSTGPGPGAKLPQAPAHLLGRPQVTHLQMSRLRSPSGRSQK